MMDVIKIRRHPKNNLKVCAMRRNGGCTKSFDNEEELFTYVIQEFGEKWAQESMIK